MTKTAKLIAEFDRYVMPTYGRLPLALVRGRGSRVWDADGKEYLDFGGGIAVNVLGHAALTQVLTEASAKLVHCSNLYYTEPQGRLARKLVELVGAPGKVFFCNSGGEANEAQYKLARKWGNAHGGRYEVLTFHGSFHGRTLAGIAATGQEKVKHGFEPAVDGFRHVPFNDLAAVAAAIGPKTAAILLEPIQGESGIQPATPEFLRGLRRLCDERGLLLQFDEVQCGIGRTGHFCGFKSIAPDVMPDSISWAKGLAGGFPMGAMWARAPFQDVLGPGTHATTFGGTPLACAVALAVLEQIERENLAANAQTQGAYFLAQVRGLNLPVIKDVRGLGLMIGVELTVEAKPVLGRLAEHGLIAVLAGTHVLRFLPALNVTRAEVDEAVAKLAQALSPR
jgi:acetylornithine aminotransferase/acetylornithine/N-succinyldiaminopimelate aminotransferase